MPKNTHKIAIAGAATLGAAALAFSVVPADAQTTTTDAVSSARVAYSTQPVQDVKASVTDQLAATSVKADAIAAKKKAAAAAAAKKKAAAAKAAAAKKKAAAEAAAKKKAAASRKAKEAANRSAKRAAIKKAAVRHYANNLDGWIKHSLDIMKSKGIPGSYHGLHKNIMRESSGNPNAINDWDINAINGIPSKGLLQVIPPTFTAYHVSGTSWNIYDPVANITAAANYAADKYGSIDNVNSAY
ncbi:transglycosylase SLT domain-containing protein [Streptomyces sp. IBSBF 2953]|uniref:transglycosylase SLT domain-containing protein n=1 Tax=Streptomyces TaxID=1883 RepID=UPI002119C845|nr:transglycosylase SLT domain-containing protein [Streptomyces scabiei]MCQ9178916.1 transglycosylase SLT domain-containing protein [Streptomyces hayashii]MDX3117671.1 transglycosylase SLT domain-containing protein [Streptomyces scabiei]